MATLVLFSAVLLVQGPGGRTVTSTSSTSTSPPQPAARGYAKGISFTPTGFDQQGISGYFAKARQAGGLVTWSGDWDALSDPRSAPYVLEAQARENNLTLLPELQILDSSSGHLLRPLNSSNEANYVTLVASFARTYTPRYIALGVEVNLLHDSDPASYQAFVSFFSTARAEIKAASPGTAVFTIFQLERMKGLDGGLFGGVNDTSKAEWGLLADFPSADLVGFTTYPGLIFHSPSSVPAGYFEEIAQHTRGPLAFTEVAWQSGSIPGWGNNETTQAGFVKDFFSLTSGLPKAVVVWAFAYDQAAPAPFDSMGLLNAAGAAKAAWTEWLEDG